MIEAIFAEITLEAVAPAPTTTTEVEASGFATTSPLRYKVLILRKNRPVEGI